MKRLLRHEQLTGESLDTLCSDALILSKDHYSEFSIGALSIRYAVANWYTRSGGQALLKNRSIGLGSRELNKRPTTLDIYERPSDRLVSLTRFAFNPRRPSDICAYKLLMPIHDALSDGQLDQKHIADLQDEMTLSHLTEPAEEDKQQLYDELSRGASGLHTDDNKTIERL